MAGMKPSPFRDLPPSEWITQNRSCFAIWDAVPVSPGHVLVVPFRQITTWWEAGSEEHVDLLQLVTEVKAIVDDTHQPDGYTIGFDTGEAAGQTIGHFHIQVIPRYRGDDPAPRGLRSIELHSAGGPAQPTTASHTAGAELLAAQRDDGLLKPELLACLRDVEFDRIDLVVSFVMRSGLELILSELDDALARGARVRILTSDYMDITDPDALAQLLDLQEGTQVAGGDLQVRVWQEPARSFHPKAYIFWSSRVAAARGFVGSSNLSQSGIDGGVEWNFAIGTADELRAGFRELWGDGRARPLDQSLLRDYRARRRPVARGAPEPVPIGVEIEPPRQPVAPTDIQTEALRALEDTRTEGHRAGLVVMATGLGKTWLAAFDSSRPEVRRTLFVAHREEILRQSLDVFRQVRTDSQLGLFYGGQKQPNADVVFASVQTLARRLNEFSAESFDYIVIDEFHHAAASTYRQVIDHFNASFLLGLTATPERMDGADLLSLCGDNLVFECDLVSGIRRDQLAPFNYLGLRDLVDFEPIPWRNGRFDPEALARAVETRERADQALDAWREHGGGPTLCFTCSITHARFLARHFDAQGVRTAAVHSGPDSAPRRDSVRQLRDRELDIIFTVDVFNEGVDIPEVETVLMLRPTDSPIVFLQQLGRGLRKASASGKTHLQVIDFIGNHRAFLTKPRTLLSLGGRSAPSTQQVLKAMRLGEFDLPEGCSVAYELEAIDLLESLVTTTRRDALIDFCTDYHQEHGYRPTAAQAFRGGMNPATARRHHGHWLGLAADLSIVTDDEARVIATHADTLRSIEFERVTKSYKLLTLRALLHDGALRSGAPIADVASTARRLLAADPRLVADARGSDFPDPLNADESDWTRFWLKWPIEHMTNSTDSIFRLVKDRIEPVFAIPPEDGEVFDALVAELVEWRLAEYYLRQRTSTSDAMRCKLSHSGGRPIIFLDRERHPNLPEGWTDVHANGELVRLNFVKVAVNVAERPGERGNALHDLLRGWFGPSAGHPGTQHAVVLRKTEQGWNLQPEQIAIPSGASVVPLFPTFEVACGAFERTVQDPNQSRLPIVPGSGRSIDSTRHFVAFASGDSMNGGLDPVRHGDPLLFEWARDLGRADLSHERVLVQVTTAEGTAATLKRLEQRSGSWQLEADAVGFNPIAGTSDMRVAARLVEVMDQRAINPLAPKIGEQFTRAQASELMGEEWNWGRWGQMGHITSGTNEVLFVTIDKTSMSTGSEYDDRFDSPDRMIWSSQNAVGPETSKGRRLLEAPGNGQLVHLFCRKNKMTPAFFYCGVVIPVSHTGSKPMSVSMRLLSPLDADLYATLKAD